MDVVALHGPEKPRGTSTNNHYLKLNPIAIVHFRAAFPDCLCRQSDRSSLIIPCLQINVSLRVRCETSQVKRTLIRRAPLVQRQEQERPASISAPHQNTRRPARDSLAANRSVKLKLDLILNAFAEPALC